MGLCALWSFDCLDVLNVLVSCIALVPVSIRQPQHHREAKERRGRYAGQGRHRSYIIRCMMMSGGTIMDVMCVSVCVCCVCVRARVCVCVCVCV